jgi:hypothetical protein
VVSGEFLLMYSFVTYLSNKTTTIRPANATFTREILSWTQSESRTELFSARNSGSRVNTENNSFEDFFTQFGSYSSISGSDERGETREPRLTSFTSRWGFEGVRSFLTNEEEETFGNSGGQTDFISWNLNSFTQSRVRKTIGMQDFETETNSGFLAAQTVNKQTTTTFTYLVQLRATQTTTAGSFFYTTTIPQGATEAQITDATKTQSVIIESRNSSTLTRTGTTTNGTESFITYTDWSVHQIVVADTVVMTVSANRRDDGVLAVAHQNSESSGINQLQYLLGNTTLVWQPDFSTERTNTRDAFTSELTYLDPSRTEQENWTGIQSRPSATTRGATSTTSATTRTTQSNITVTTSFLTVNENTFTCQDWRTFTTQSTTTNTSTSGTILATSFSLNTGETFLDEGQDEDGNLVVSTFLFMPQGISYQTGVSVTNQISTTETTTNQTITVWEDHSHTTLSNSIFTIKTPQLRFSTETFGVQIKTTAIPWIAEPNFGLTQVSSLDTQTGLTSTVSSTVQFFPFYSTEIIFGETVSETNSGGFTDESNTSNNGFTRDFQRGITNFFTSSGSFFSTRANSLRLVQPTAIARAWKTGGDFRNHAAPVNLDFTTTPTRTEGALILTLQNNEHTIGVAFGQKPQTAQITPREWVMPFTPTFSSILSTNACGYGAHPSAWSTITVSREGANLSSTWQFINGSDETASGTCILANASTFPFGVVEAGTSILGGNMQPNTNIISFKARGVALTYRATPSGTQSGFETIETNQIGVQTIANAAAITIRQTIPAVEGPGYFQFNRLDNGLP